MQDVNGSDTDALAADEVRAASISGARWVTLGRIVAEAAALLVSIVLARLLTPADFGDVAIATAVFVVAVGLPMASLSGGLVQAERLSDDLVRSTTALAIAFGLAGGAIVVGIGAAVEALVGHEAGALVMLAAPTVPLAMLGAVSFGLLQRRLDFRAVTIAEVGGSMIGSLAAVIAAVAGLGAASLVVGYVVVTAFQTGFAIWACPPLRPRLTRAGARASLSFGGPATGAFTLRALLGYADYAVLSLRTSATQVGLYWRGFQLAVDYQGKATGILQRLAFPVLSRSASHDEIRRLRARMVRVHTTALFPLLGLLIVTAPGLVPLLYGPQWSGSIVPAQILAVAGMLTVINAGTGPVMLALGKPKPLIWVNGVELTLLVTVVWVTAPAGLPLVCAGVVGVRAIATVLYQWALLDRIVGIPIRESLHHDVLPGGCATALLVAVGMLVMEALTQAGVSDELAMVPAGALGVLAFALTLHVRFRPAFDDLSALASNLRPRVA